MELETETQPIGDPQVQTGTNTGRRRRFGGIVERRERWCLTWKGRILAAGLILALFATAVLRVYWFLAPTHRIPARLLVIEGWTPRNMMQQAAAEFHAGSYDQVVLVRPVLDVEDKFESGRYSGFWLARSLVQHGVPDDKLTTLFPIVARKDRTYHSALAVKHWVAEQNLSITALDVATEGPHARRSRLLYEMAFGDNVKVGIIAMESPMYDPQHWWRTSEGVREILGESIAYLYARLLFYPSESDSRIQTPSDGPK